MQHLQSRLPLYKKWFEEAAEQSSQDWRLLGGHRLSGVEMESERRLVLRRARV